MSTPHTPGPWTTDEFIDKSSCIVVLDSGPECPCYVAMIPDNRINNVSHQQANARLIAAAPDLLKTLIAVSNDSICMKGFHEQFRHQIRSTITKATQP